MGDVMSPFSSLLFLKGQYKIVFSDRLEASQNIWLIYEADPIVALFSSANLTKTARTTA